MNTEAKVITFPVKTKLVCSDCGAPGEGSCNCGVAYVTPGVRAEEAVKANPEKSDRAIAEEIGVHKNTIARARKATGPQGPVEKRVGKDGKARKQPKVRSRPVEDKAREAVRPRITSGAPVKAREVAKETGISHVMVEQAAAMERARAEARIELLAELGVDPSTFAMSAKAKLEIAKRQMEHKLTVDHAARMAQIDEEVRKRVLDKNKDYLKTLNEMQEKAENDLALYQKWLGNRTPIFTDAEYFTILKALDPSIEHQLAKPDPELVKLFNDATVLMNSKRDRLTLKRR